MTSYNAGVNCKACFLKWGIADSQVRPINLVLCPSIPKRPLRQRHAGYGEFALSRAAFVTSDLHIDKEVFAASDEVSAAMYVK